MIKRPAPVPITVNNYPPGNHYIVAMGGIALSAIIAYTCLSFNGHDPGPGLLTLAGAVVGFMAGRQPAPAAVLPEGKPTEKKH